MAIQSHTKSSRPFIANGLLFLLGWGVLLMVMMVWFGVVGETAVFEDAGVPVNGR
ncbi:MAG: hypothetical protein GY943_38465 [Chloroflexi bacterium]|nr:hypothetical protein [Chloroflexota bacterium]